MTNDLEVTQRHAVRAIILTPQTQVLMMQIKSPETQRTFWITPGGGKEGNEAPETTLRRELQEELGLIHFEMGPLLWRRQHTFDWLGKRICQTEQFHLLTVDQPFEPVVSDPVEAEVIQAFHWWTLREFIDTSEQFTPQDLPHIIQRYLKAGVPETLPDTEVIID